jgi:AcrR family transcriptional regulator
MSKKSEIKRELILTKAKEVFIRKGFNRTTMKDIAGECEISRGGIYLYFSATDEIFVEVVKKHNQTKMQFLNEKIEKSTDFTQLIDEFFSQQKEHLLNMEKSLFAAMIEFCFEHKSSSDKDFYTEQFFNTKKMILELLKFGKKENVVKSNDIDRLADSVMFLIEGLRSLAVSGNISEEIADKQINVCRNMVCSINI